MQQLIRRLAALSRTEREAVKNELRAIFRRAELVARNNKLRGIAKKRHLLLPKKEISIGWMMLASVLCKAMKEYFIL